MNRITTFLKGKGFYLALAACVLAAAGSSFWAIRSVMDRMKETEKPRIEQEGPATWQMPDIQVEEKVNDLPKPSAVPSQPSPLPSGSAEQPQPDTELQESVTLAEPSFVKPVDGQIMQPFSGDELVYNETLGDWRTHNGVDIACEPNAEVKNAVAGTVSRVYEDGMWGQVVEVQSDETLWRYVGLLPDSVKVKEGQTVEPGTALACVGEITAEVASEPHLHLEVVKGDKPVDPQRYFE